MKRCNKKGFTIVELVIVIAVIAILAAVLIPTIAGLVKKANEASDTAVAKNMNTALAEYSAKNGNPENFDEVLEAIKAYGYVIDNLNAKANGNFYAWDKANNQIVYLTKDKEVIYKNTAFNAADLVSVASNQKTVIDAIAAGGSVVVAGDITVTDKSAKHMNVISSDTDVNLGANTIKLDIPDATNTTANWIALKIEGGDVVIDATSGGISTADNGELYAIALYNPYSEGSDVTIKGGNFVAGGHAVYIRMPNSTVTIEGGYFQSTKTEGVLNIRDEYGNSCTDEAQRSKIIVKGGTFVNFDVANVDSHPEYMVGVGEVALADGYTVEVEVVDENTTLYKVVPEIAP